MQQMENSHGPMTISNAILIRQPLLVLTIGSFGTRTVTQIESLKYPRDSRPKIISVILYKMYNFT